MALLNSEKGKEIVKHVTLKNVKLNIGHDLAGMFADFFLDGKKMGYFNDDGRGGETDVEYLSKEHQKEFEAFLIKNDVANIMFQNGWDFLEDVAKIDLHCQAEEIINAAVNLIEQQKAEKKIEKACLKGIYRMGSGAYSGLAFKLPLKDLVKIYGEKGRELIQNAYDKMKAELKEGEKIVNKNLEELGIKL